MLFLENKQAAKWFNSEQGANLQTYTIMKFLLLNLDFLDHPCSSLR